MASNLKIYVKTNGIKSTQSLISAACVCVAGNLNEVEVCLTCPLRSVWPPRSPATSGRPKRSAPRTPSASPSIAPDHEEHPPDTQKNTPSVNKS